MRDKVRVHENRELIWLVYSAEPDCENKGIKQGLGGVGNEDLSARREQAMV